MDWECGDRDKATCQRLIARLTRWRTRLYCTDDYAVYDVLLPIGQRYAGKDETHGIERDNARQRHWLARFRRRSIVVSKTKRMVDSERDKARLSSRQERDHELVHLSGFVVLNPVGRISDMEHLAALTKGNARLGDS